MDGPNTFGDFVTSTQMLPPLPSSVVCRNSPLPYPPLPSTVNPPLLSATIRLLCLPSSAIISLCRVSATAACRSAVIRLFRISRTTYCARRRAASRGRYLIRRHPIPPRLRRCVSFVSMLDRPMIFFMHPLAHLHFFVRARAAPQRRPERLRVTGAALS